MLGSYLINKPVAGNKSISVYFFVIFSPKCSQYSWKSAAKMFSSPNFELGYRSSSQASYGRSSTSPSIDPTPWRHPPTFKYVFQNFESILNMLHLWFFRISIQTVITKSHFDICYCFSNSWTLPHASFCRLSTFESRLKKTNHKEFNSNICSILWSNFGLIFWGIQEIRSKFGDVAIVNISHKAHRHFGGYRFDQLLVRTPHRAPHRWLKNQI